MLPALARRPTGRLGGCPPVPTPDAHARRACAAAAAAGQYPPFIPQPQAAAIEEPAARAALAALTRVPLTLPSVGEVETAYLANEAVGRSEADGACVVFGVRAGAAFSLPACPTPRPPALSLSILQAADTLTPSPPRPHPPPSHRPPPRRRPARLRLLLPGVSPPAAPAGRGGRARVRGRPGRLGLHRPRPLCGGGRGGSGPGPEAGALVRLLEGQGEGEEEEGGGWGVGGGEAPTARHRHTHAGTHTRTRLFLPSPASLSLTLSPSLVSLSLVGAPGSRSAAP
jgi:hypothetical protein